MPRGSVSFERVRVECGFSIGGSTATIVAGTGGGHAHPCILQPMVSQRRAFAPRARSPTRSGQRSWSGNTVWQCPPNLSASNPGPTCCGARIRSASSGLPAIWVNSDDWRVTAVAVAIAPATAPTRTAASETVPMKASAAKAGAAEMARKPPMATATHMATAKATHMATAEAPPWPPPPWPRRRRRAPSKRSPSQLPALHPRRSLPGLLLLFS